MCFFYSSSSLFSIDSLSKKNEKLRLHNLVPDVHGAVSFCYASSR